MIQVIKIAHLSLCKIYLIMAIIIVNAVSLHFAPEQWLDSYYEAQIRNVNRSAILKKINRQRALESDDKSNMNLLYYDKQLEMDAFNYASKCMYSVTNYPISKRFNKNVGVTLCNSQQSYNFEKYCVKKWLREGKLYNSKTNECLDQYESCFNYKQLMWAEARFVGCSYNFCNFVDNLSRHFYHQYLFVCFFGPVYKFFDAIPFRIGSRCSECEENFFSNHTQKLCDSELECVNRVCDEGNVSGCICECSQKKRCRLEITSISQCVNVTTNSECYCLCDQLIKNANKETPIYSYDSSNFDTISKTFSDFSIKEHDDFDV